MIVCILTLRGLWRRGFRLPSQGFPILKIGFPPKKRNYSEGVLIPQHLRHTLSPACDESRCCVSHPTSSL